MTWAKGQPPNDGRTYLLRFLSGIVCSGRYRGGTLGEPSPSTVDWRCDCCGRFATPVEWAHTKEEADRE